MELVLYSFGSAGAGCDPGPPLPHCIPNSAHPTALLQGRDGNLYGTTLLAGANNTGTFFRLTPSGAQTDLFDFGASGSAQTQGPASLLQGADGNFYGVAATGGQNGTGAVFQFTPAGVQTVLYAFGPLGSTDGQNPLTLLQGTDGNFYGSTQSGGTNGTGAIFRLTPAGAETLLYSFGPAGGADGQNALALIQGSDGNLYGAAAAGGVNGTGAVFEVTLSGIETVLYAFGAVASADAQFPTNLLQGTDGNFYGIALDGGMSKSGAVFRVKPSGAESVVYSFGPANGPDAAYPTSLFQASDGTFYGTASNGGANAYGALFELTPGGLETVLYSFPSITQGNNQNPVLSLRATDGTFYGATSSGGANASGVIFKLGG